MDIIKLLQKNGYEVLIIAAILFTVGYFFFYFKKVHLEVSGVKKYTREKKRDWSNIFLLLATALLVKLFFAAVYEGHGTDMSCFRAWSGSVFEGGFGNFYTSGQFADYPPGYMALLWVVEAMRRLFSFETATAAANCLIKLFPILCDLGTSYLIYIIAKKKFSESSSLLLSLTYALNPSIVLNSSIWGQVDGVFTLFVILTVYLCMEEKRIPAYFVFVVGVLLKPQTLIFTPILIWTIVEQVFMRKITVKIIVKDLVGGLSAIAGMILFMVPFGVQEVLAQYVRTLSSYEYVTVNAYNFWSLFSLNWKEQSGKFIFMSFENWGTLAILASVALSGYVFFKLKEDKSRYFASMAVIVSTMFLFSVRMHERYLFPVMALSLFAFLLKPTKEWFMVYIGYSMVQFLNVGYVLYHYVKDENTGPTGAIVAVTAILTLVVYVCMFRAIKGKSTMKNLEVANTTTRGKKRSTAPVVSTEKPEKKRFSILRTKKMKKFTKWDFIVLGSIMLVYSAFALYDLGSMEAPQTNWEAKKDDEVIQLDLGSEKQIDSIQVFLGAHEDKYFYLSASTDGVNYDDLGMVTASTVFAWNEVQQYVGADGEGEVTKEYLEFTKPYRFLKFTTTHVYNYTDSYEDENGNTQIQELEETASVILNEMVILDEEGNKIMPANAGDYSSLFDEQDLYIEAPSFRDQTYFDEIYHARSAYEMNNGLKCYEWTHPPLGKVFIGIGIDLFGMTPFGWRIIGVLFGIGMLPFLYLFGRRLFDCKTWVAGAATALFAFDFMHFTQTRIATIDVYGTFFIIAMFYFMLQYAQTSFYDTPLWKTFIPLGLSAIMMGLGCASKWTAVYAAAGLAVFFFVIMGVRCYEYKLAKKNIKGESNGIPHEKIVAVFKGNLIKTLLFCVLFFVIIAGAIYVLSYLTFSDGTDHSLFKRMWDNQLDMFGYHSGLDATHPYSSTWYEWPTLVRPVWYYGETLSNGLKEGISAFGNPMVWWVGVPAFIYMIYLVIKEKDRVAIFLSFTYLVQLLPWVLVPRCTFAYHYFPSVPFVTLMIGYVMVRMVEKKEKRLTWVYVYCAAAFLLFALFYPVLSGQAVSGSFVENVLRWLPEWQLIN